jgi:hypothetical protein
MRGESQTQKIAPNLYVLWLYEGEIDHPGAAQQDGLKNIQSAVRRYSSSALNDRVGQVFVVRVERL